MTQVAFDSIEAETENIDNLAKDFSSGIDQMVNHPTNRPASDTVLETGFVLLEWDLVVSVLFVVEDQ